MRKENDESLNIDELKKQASKLDKESLIKLIQKTTEELEKVKEKLKEKEKENEDKEKILKMQKEILKQKNDELEKINEKIKQMKNNDFEKDILSQDFIDEFKSKFTIEQQKEISELQQLLIGNNESNIKFDNYTMKRAFDYKFGNKIDNDNFISYIKEGISILYSNNDNKDAFEFFKNIRKYIKDFLYIPMLRNNTLYELKKFIYLKVISNQLKFDGSDLLSNYIFYNNHISMSLLLRKFKLIS